MIASLFKFGQGCTGYAQDMAADPQMENGADLDDLALATLGRYKVTTGGVFL